MSENNLLTFYECISNCHAYDAYDVKSTRTIRKKQTNKKKTKKKKTVRAYYFFPLQINIYIEDFENASPYFCTFLANRICD